MQKWELGGVSQGQEILCKGPGVPGSVEDVKGGMGLEGLGPVLSWDGGLSCREWGARENAPTACLPHPQALPDGPFLLHQAFPALSSRPELGQARDSAGYPHLEQALPSLLALSLGLGMSACPASEISGATGPEGGKLWEQA